MIKTSYSMTKPYEVNTIYGKVCVSPIYICPTTNKTRFELYNEIDEYLGYIDSIIEPSLADIETTISLKYSST